MRNRSAWRRDSCFAPRRSRGEEPRRLAWRSRVGERRRLRRGFTVIETMVVFILLSLIAAILTDLMISENKQIEAFSEDLTVNAEARQIFAIVSRDIRAAHAIRLGQGSLVLPADPEPQFVNEAQGSVVLLFRAPVIVDPQAGFQEWGIHYWLVGPGSTPPAGLPKPREYRTGEAVKHVFPVIRTVFRGTDERDRSRILEEKVIGWVRGLIFYQHAMTSAPGGPGNTQSARRRPAIVSMRLTMAAFRQVAGTWRESYRETLTTSVSSRPVISSAIGENLTP